MNKKETKEIGKVLAVTAILMNSLILTAIVGVFWLVQMILMQINRLNALIYRFRF